MATTVIVNFNPTPQILAAHGLGKGGKVQQFLDSEIVRLSDPYVPFLTGRLKQSGIENTVIGSGKVIYNTPYAKTNWYENRGMGIQGMSKGGIRGREWVLRMWAEKKDQVIRGAKSAIT